MPADLLDMNLRLSLSFGTKKPLDFSRLQITTVIVVFIFALLDVM